MRAPIAAVLAVSFLLQAVSAMAASIEIPSHIATHADGRAPIETLYRASLGLVDKGWKAEVITYSAPTGVSAPLPIIALRSPKAGPALWILAGIHGEEPAGPNAVAAVIDDIAKFGERHPVVLLPVMNPHGYARNWRYLNVAEYSEDVEGRSVGDSSHLLISLENPEQARAAAPSSPEAGAITAWILERQADYPVAITVDLHEDNLIDEGYVYSQGVRGAQDELATLAVDVLRENHVPIKMGGATRFDEPIERGIIGPVTDSSIDELLSAHEVIANGVRRSGPSARTVLVLETPAASLPLSQRVAAHAALLKRLTEALAINPAL